MPLLKLLFVHKTFSKIWFLSSITLIAVIYWTQPQVSNRYSTSQPVYNVNTLIKNINEMQQVVFEDRTLQSGITSTHSQKSGDIHGLHESLGAGACSFDFDGDGWLDILILTGSGNTHYYGHQEWWQSKKNSVQLYQNRQDGTFINVTEQLGLATQSQSTACGIGDFDGDGNPDVFLANRGENEIWRNLGDKDSKRFQKIPFDKPSTSSWSTSVTIADFNDDLLPDIYVTNYLKFRPNSLTFEASSGFQSEKHPDFDAALHSGAENEYLINHGNWQFTNKAKIFNVDNAQGRGLASTADDINNDGLIDILVANDDDSENKVFINQGSRFSDQSTQFGLGTLSSSTGITPYTHNGHKHYHLSTGASNYNRLFEQQDGTIKLVDASEKRDLNRLSSTFEHSWPPAIADFDLDGKPDIFTPNGLTTLNDDEKSLSQNQPNYLLATHNDVFTRQTISDAQTITPISSSRCAIAGDFDNNGVSDVFITSNNGLPQLLINKTPASAWVGFVFETNVFVRNSSVAVNLNSETIKLNPKNGSNGFCWQDRSRFILPLNLDTADQSDLEISIEIDNQILTGSIKPNAYYHVTEKGVRPIPKPAPPTTSKIRAKRIDDVLEVIKLLIKSEQTELALRELEIVLAQIDHTQTKHLAHLLGLITDLAKQHQLRIAPNLLTSAQAEQQLIGIELSKNLESDMLARWLFPLIHAENTRVSCAASQTLEHFFAEEEAMTLTKYASLTSLIRKAIDQTDSSLCAIQALGEAERFRAVAPLKTLLREPRSEVRHRSIVALGRIRERDASNALITLLFSKTETPENRLAALNAISAVDAQFDLIQTIEAASPKVDSRVMLAVLNQALSEQSVYRRQQKDQIRKWLSLKIGRDLNRLTPSKFIDHALITKSTGTVARLKALSAADSKHSLAALKALIKIDQQNRTKHLMSVLDQNPAFRLDASTPVTLNAKEYLKLAKLLPNNDKAKKHYLRYVPITAINAELVELLKKAPVADAPDLISLLSSSNRLTTNSALCSAIANVLTSPDTQHLGLALLGNKPTFVTKCSQNGNVPISSTNLLGLIGKHETLDKHFIELLQAKQNGDTRRTLLSMVKNKGISLETRLLIIQSMPTPLAQSHKKALDAIFNSKDKPEIIIAAAKKLASINNWAKDNASDMRKRVQDAIDDNSHTMAIGLTTVLFPVAPKASVADLLNE